MNFNLFLLLENNNIRTLLGNNQGYYHLFNKFHEKEGVPLESLQQLINNIKRLKPLIKKNLITFDKYEDLVDYLIEIEEDSNVKKIKSLFPTKAKFLIDSEVERIIIDNKYKYDIFKNFLRKVSYYIKNPKNFSTDLSGFIKNMTGDFNLNVYLSKAKESECLVVEATETELILIVNNYASMKKIGTQSWCIVRDEYMFDRYVKGRVQFVIFDFTKNVSDIKSMIGVTLNENGKLYAAHFKNDSKCPLDYLQDNFPSVLENTDLYFTIANLKFSKSLKDLKDTYTILKYKDSLNIFHNFIDIEDSYQLNWVFENMDSIDAVAKNVSTNIIGKLNSKKTFTLDQISIIEKYDLKLKAIESGQGNIDNNSIKLSFDKNRVYNFLVEKNFIIPKFVLEYLDIDVPTHIKSMEYKFIDKSLYDDISFEEHFNHIDNDYTLTYLYYNYSKNKNKFDYLFNQTNEYKKLMRVLKKYEDIKIVDNNIIFRPSISELGSLFRIKYRKYDDIEEQILKMLEYTYDLDDVSKIVYSEKFEDKLEEMYFEYIINSEDILYDYIFNEGWKIDSKDLFFKKPKEEIVFSFLFNIEENSVKEILGDDFDKAVMSLKNDMFYLFFSSENIKDIVEWLYNKVINFIGGINDNISGQVEFYNKITTDEAECHSIIGYNLRTFYTYCKVAYCSNKEFIFYDDAHIRGYYERF